MRRAAPGSMKECIATFEAQSRDEATALYEGMYEDLAVTWEAKTSGWPPIAPSSRRRSYQLSSPFVRTADRTVMSHSGEDMLLSGHAFTER